MKLRDRLDKFPVLVPAVAIVVLIGALVAIAYSTGLLSSGSDYGPSPVYYWDIGQNTAFVASSENMPPIDAPSGAGNGVRAFLYSCGECEPDQWFGYLETYSNQYTAAVADGSIHTMPLPDRDALMDESHLVRSLDGDENDWVLKRSADGSAIRNEVMERCAEGRPELCVPQE